MQKLGLDGEEERDKEQMSKEQMSKEQNDDEEPKDPPVNGRARTSKVRWVTSPLVGSLYVPSPRKRQRSRRRTII